MKNKHLTTISRAMQTWVNSFKTFKPSFTCMPKSIKLTVQVYFDCTFLAQSDDCYLLTLSKSGSF